MSVHHMKMPSSAYEAASPLHRALLDLFACAGARRHGSVYVSTPITTGRRYLRWLLEGSNPETFDESVIEANTAAAARLVAETRRRYHSRTVIDPTRLGEFPDWGQNDYHKFWEMVICHYADTVVFSEGWQFSTGAVWEMRVALSSGIRALDHKFEPLSPPTAMKLVDEAVEAFRSLPRESVTLLEAAEALRPVARKSS